MSLAIDIEGMRLS